MIDKANCTYRAAVVVVVVAAAINNEKMRVSLTIGKGGGNLTLNNRTSNCF